jgi:GT2 family glycosyltransferase
MFIPIVLQTFNRLSYTMQVISAIKNYILYPIKLIVVDNGSSDGTREYLSLCKSLCLIDHLVLNESNLGIATPKNQGLSIVKEFYSYSKYVCFSDNDIIPPFIRTNGCVFEHIVKLMDENPIIGMCGIDLNRQNSPSNQEWWWRLRQHFITMPEFTEIAIGFWMSVIRYEFFDEFKFVGESSYGKVDESLRNYIGLVRKQKVGLLKGYYNGKETIECVGTHLGWTEDFIKSPDYIAFKKAERYKAELVWKEKDRKW